MVGTLTLVASLMMPPFGLLVLTVKAAMGDRALALSDMFRGAVPYWLILLVLAAAVAVFPSLATGLATMLPSL